jgi:CheY-like chemotaxis protein
MQGDKENFLNQGMTHYISKPFQVDDLKNLMMEILPG